MTPAQIRGYETFENRTVCDNCYTLRLFTDNAYYNIGLRPADEDAGRMDVTNDAADFGRFKTPSLRDVGLRGALTHAGWTVDAQDSIDFYNAVSLGTGYTQFTENQSGIPTARGGFVDYSMLKMPERFQVNIVDFLANALTDPRVANQEFPFDRRLLGSEVAETMPVPFFGLSSDGCWCMNCVFETTKGLDLLFRT